MRDWKDTKYDHGPKPDPLGDPMSGENIVFGLGPWVVAAVFLGCLALIAYALLF